MHLAPAEDYGYGFSGSRNCLSVSTVTSGQTDRPELPLSLLQRIKNQPPILNIFVPQTEQVPVFAFLPFFMVTSFSPYSGTLTVNASSSAAPGTYYVVLDATGDDPSTNNTTLTVTVEGQTSATTSATTSASTTTVIGSNTTVATTKPSTSTSASTSVAYTTTGAYYPPSGGGPGGLSATTAYLAGAVIALILGIIGIFRAKSNEWKMVIAGAMLIFIGIFVWLYGDFSGGLMQYIYGGVAAAAVGILVWLYADFKWKMFSKMDRSSYAIILGVILLLIGMGLWLYADFGGGSLTDLWAGVGAMVLGVIVWAAAYFV